jgi:alkylhydroperoxidase family enzyme
VPNFFKVMADHTEMPGAVYMAADASLMNGVLRPPEQQAVLLDMARYHNCRYDAIVHTRMGLDAGLPPDIIDAILAGDVPEHERYGALVEAARVTCEQRGWLNQDTLQGLQSRSVGYGELYEIFALIGMKTFSAYTHHMAGTDVDGPLQATEDAMSTVPEKPDSVRRQRLFLG